MHRRLNTATLACASALLLALAGCGDDEAGPTEDDGATQSEQSDSADQSSGDADGSEDATDPDATDGDATDPAESSEAGSGADEGSSAVEITIDGKLSTAAWNEPICTEAQGEMTIDTAATSDGGKLTVKIPIGDASEGATVSMVVPGEGVPLLNLVDAEGGFADGHLTFDGELAAPGDPTLTHQIAIDLTCPA